MKSPLNHFVHMNHGYLCQFKSVKEETKRIQEQGEEQLSICNLCLFSPKDIKSACNFFVIKISVTFNFFFFFGFYHVELDYEQIYCCLFITIEPDRRLCSLVFKRKIVHIFHVAFNLAFALDLATTDCFSLSISLGCVPQMGNILKQTFDSAQSESIQHLLQQVIIL